MSNKIKNLDESYTMSKIFHEIKNPLTLISCSLQLIQRDHPEVHSFQFWDQTMEDLKKLRFLIDDVSKMEHSKMINKQPILVSDFITDLLCSMESFLLDQAVFLEVENQLAVSSFPGDSQKLQQVLVNLIKNAVEASCEDSVVSLIFQQSKEYLIISVKDQGSGMSQEELSQIFQPFYTKKSAGTGLGLPICQRIIEAHEGILSAESKESFGSCFSIQLPLF